MFSSIIVDCMRDDKGLKAASWLKELCKAIEELLIIFYNSLTNTLFMLPNLLMF